MLEQTNIQPLSQFSRELEDLFRTRHPVVWVTTIEEHRAYQEIVKTVESLSFNVNYNGEIPFLGLWSSQKGLKVWDSMSDKMMYQEAAIPIPIDIIDYIENRSANYSYIVILRDYDVALQDKKVLRRLRDFIFDCEERPQKTYLTFVITTSSEEIPIEISKSIAKLDLPLPSVSEFKDRFDILTHKLSESKLILLNPNWTEEKHSLCSFAQSKKKTMIEFESMLRLKALSSS